MLAAAGCSSATAAGPPTGDPLAGVAPPGSRQAISLIDAFALANQSLAQIRDDVAKDTAACMRRAGFEFDDQTRTALLGIQGETVKEYLDYARSHGYGVADAAAQQIADPVTFGPESNYLHAGRTAVGQAAYWTALTGSASSPEMDSVELPQVAPAGPQQGCLPVAVQHKLRDLPFLSVDAGPVIRSFVATEFDDPDVRAHDAGWSACMAGRGYQFAGYLDAAAAYLKTTDTLSAQQLVARRGAEIRQASADATCYLTDIHPYRRATEARFLRSLAQAHPGYRERVAAVLTED